MKPLIFYSGIITIGLCLGADFIKAPNTLNSDFLDVVFLTQDKAIRAELFFEVDEKPINVIWDKTFASILEFFDRDGDGVLGQKEAELLPSALAIRHHMGKGFTPPIGKAPSFKILDLNGDQRITTEELGAYYRSEGLGRALVGVGRIPTGKNLSDALFKQLDQNGDSKITTNELIAAPDILKKLDKNDDELISAGELVPKMLYPGTAGTTLLMPPNQSRFPDSLSNFPMILLPRDRSNSNWVSEIESKIKDFKKLNISSLASGATNVRWISRHGKGQNIDKFVFTFDKFRIEGWEAQRLWDRSSRLTPE